MDTNKLKRFATEARNILMQGVVHRLTALGFLPDGSVTEEPQQQGGGATFMGDTVTQDFFNKWQSLRRAVSERKIEEVAEEAAYTWFNRLVAIRIMVKNGLASPVLEYESDDVLIPILVSEARQGRMPEMDDDSMRKLTALLDDDSKTSDQFALLIVAYCHSNPVINSCFGHISDYTELLLPANILTEGGFVHMLNNTEFISEDDFKSPELIGWLYQFYISEKKDDVFASFKKGKKAEAKDIPAATQIFTPNWIVKYMVQNTVGRIYLDNNPYSDIKESMQYLVEPEEPTPSDAIFRFDDIHDLTCADLACGSGHILNECFDLLYQLYIEEGYSRKKAIEDIFKYNLTGVDLDTRAKQLAQFSLLMKACQKDPSFADAHCMPKVLDMPKVDKYTYIDTCGHFDCAYGLSSSQKIHEELADAFMLMANAENLGSIMKFEISDSTREYMIKCIESYDAEPKYDNTFSSLIHGYSLILTLTQKYSALIANPPYMGNGNMNEVLCDYVKANYPDSKVDLYSVFIEMMIDKCHSEGKMGCITMETWMFLKSFEKLRTKILDKYFISSIGHFGWYIIGIAFGTAMAVIEKHPSKGRKGEYSYTTIDDINREINIPYIFPLKDNGRYSKINQDIFNQIEGSPISYWISQTVFDTFTFDNVRKYFIGKEGVGTRDDNRFLRNLWEVSISKIGVNKKWVLSDKAGNRARWYGNILHLMNWENDGYEIKNFRDEKGKLKSRPQNLDYLFREGVSWAKVSTSTKAFRYRPSGFAFNDAAPAIFPRENGAELLKVVLGCLNCKVGMFYLSLNGEPINTTVSNVESVPFRFREQQILSKIVDSNISISRQDWDAHETSWDFERNPLVEYSQSGYMSGDEQVFLPKEIKTVFNQYVSLWSDLFKQLHNNEEELNRQFIEIYGLQDELTPDVPLDEITILQQGELSIENNNLIWHSDVVMKQLISYAVGCMMGRYSIDKEGLILANQGDGLKEFAELVPNSRFEVDDDGIIPLMASDTDFADNATKRFKQWLSVTFGEETLVENLNYIEGALGKSLDDYFVKDFWKDHKKMYQNRPIYWLFSSKKGAFQCLAYMHRMNPYTAESIRTKYLLPHIEWLMQKQSEMEANAANLTTAERRKLDTINKQIEECREYHDRLHVIADQQIAFDLDDGVVVNYAKFGDVLQKLR